MSSLFTKFIKTDEKAENVAQFVPSKDDDNTKVASDGPSDESATETPKVKAPSVCCGSCS